MTGSKVSQYELLDRLGSGGMGDIYRAKDTRLNRMVAIKVLPQSDAGDETRKRRFIQEAQSASSLNHPNIITVHDILSENGTDFLVMELVTGQTLAQMIPDEGMLPSDVLNYGSQIAGALAAAHAAGIVHRDIKPNNIMITGNKLVKVLDFGLAKATFKGLPSETDETVGAPITRAGAIMGTVNYMSPEQAEGKPVDSRSDIFSFGIVLYEMVTGHAAFARDSAVGTMSAILRDEPAPVRELSPNAPGGIAEIIHGCLRKDREQRYQSIDEVRIAIDMLRKGYNPGTSPTATGTRLTAASVQPPKKKSRTPVWAIVALGVVLINVSGQYFAKRRNPRPRIVEQPTTAPVAPSGALTNDSIVKMVEAKIRTSAILDHIRASTTNFDLSTDEVIRLSKAGVPDAVIQAMRDPSRIPEKKEPAPAASAPPPAATPTPAAQTLAVALADGIPVALRLAHDIPNDAKAGMPLKFEVTKEVVVDGAVVIAQGAAVTGSIAEEGKRAIVSLKKMTFELSDVEAAGGKKLKVRATPTGSGPTRRPVDQGKKKVKDIASPAGTEYVAYIDGAQAVTIQR